MSNVQKFDVRSVRARRQRIRAVWAPSRARRVLNNRLVWGLFSAALALCGGLWFQAQVSAVHDAQSAWGQSLQVVVISAPVGVGELVQGSFDVMAVPVAMAPDSAWSLDEHGPVGPGARAKVPLVRGEILVAERITSSQATSLPSGTVALSLAVVEQVPLISVGDLVDLYAVDSANFSSTRVAHNVVVLGLSDGGVTVAVRPDQVEQVAAASLRPMTIALVG